MDLREVWEFIKDTSGIILIIIFVILLKIFVITPISVVGDSMKGTVNDEDWLLMEMISPKFKIKRFDVVVCNGTNPKYIVKRVIGLPGDTIEFKDNKLYLNNQETKEPYLKPEIITADMEKVTIPEGKYFVVGDNRGVSIDSRRDGPYEKDHILGKVVMRIWPLKGLKFIK